VTAKSQAASFFAGNRFETRLKEIFFRETEKILTPETPDLFPDFFK